MKGFERESNVQYYGSRFPELFERAEGPYLYDTRGRPYLDFLSGAGALNYGHNDPDLKSALISYLESNYIANSLDLHTVSKLDFIKSFEDIILLPRSYRYKLQFTGPTGANAVEAAIKLARKVTGRHNIAYFSNSYHGVSLGALSVTSSVGKRKSAGVPLTHGIALPYDNYFGGNEISFIEKMLATPGSGVDQPAAVIIETIQGEGGINVASGVFLQQLQHLLKSLDILLIIDDIQAGCGRAGSFFSFEYLELVPDIICLSKSLSGFGLPMSLVLIRDEIDVWKPGEHNGTFRGNNLAFVTGKAALEKFWRDNAYQTVFDISRQKIELLKESIAEKFKIETKGRGMMSGFVLPSADLTERFIADSFKRGLILESVGADNCVVKLFPPINAPIEVIEKGFKVIDEILQELL